MIWFRCLKTVMRSNTCRNVPLINVKGVFRRFLTFAVQTMNEIIPIQEWNLLADEKLHQFFVIVAVLVVSEWQKKKKNQERKIHRSTKVKNRER